MTQPRAMAENRKWLNDGAPLNTGMGFEELCKKTNGVHKAQQLQTASGTPTT